MEKGERQKRGIVEWIFADYSSIYAFLIRHNCNQERLYQDQDKSRFTLDQVLSSQDQD